MELAAFKVISPPLPDPKLEEDKLAPSTRVRFPVANEMLPAFPELKVAVEILLRTLGLKGENPSISREDVLTNICPLVAAPKVKLLIDPPFVIFILSVKIVISPDLPNPKVSLRIPPAVLAMGSLPLIVKYS